MHTVDTRSIEAAEGRSGRAAWWPGHDLVGNADDAVILDLEPGAALVQQTDGPDIVLIVMAGELVFEIGNTRHAAGPGAVTVMPANTERNVRNVGGSAARVISFVSRARAIDRLAPEMRNTA